MLIKILIIEWLTFAEIILTHRNVLNVHFSSNIYLSSENIKFEIQILRNINKHTTFGIILKSVITRHAENVYQIWFCLLSELTILTSFFFCIFETLWNIWCNYYYAWIFPVEKYDMSKRKQLQCIVAFSSKNKKPYTAIQSF